MDLELLFAAEQSERPFQCVGEARQDLKQVGELPLASLPWEGRLDEGLKVPLALLVALPLWALLVVLALLEGRADELVVGASLLKEQAPLEVAKMPLEWQKWFSWTAATSAAQAALPARCWISARAAAAGPRAVGSEPWISSTPWEPRKSC